MLRLMRRSGIYASMSRLANMAPKHSTLDSFDFATPWPNARHRTDYFISNQGYRTRIHVLTVIHPYPTSQRNEFRAETMTFPSTPSREPHMPARELSTRTLHANSPRVFPTPYSANDTDMPVAREERSKCLHRTPARQTPPRRPIRAPHLLRPGSLTSHHTSA
jgi:hypothetical protein